ncbi:MAG: sulfatase [Acidobacteriota bacterium]
MSRLLCVSRRWARALLVLGLGAPSAWAQGPSLVLQPTSQDARRFPDIVLLSVDTLRYDRLSGNGYKRRTSPAIDALMGAGVQFDQARVVEPLTCPSMASLLTSLHPHEHGASRNGLSVRPDLPSLPQMLASKNYSTGAFVGNWTLRNELSGLGEFFETYEEVVSRKRWFGLFFSEATAEDLNDEAMSWIRDQVKARDRRPFFAWVHYVEPHAPYRFWDELAPGLGPGLDRGDPSDRYDTEVAFVDRAIGAFLAELESLVPKKDTLVLFVSDHGESLGEHGYWGHGRNLHEPGLRIPMSMTWSGRLKPARVEAPASILDLMPTLLGLLDLRVAGALQGYDWSPWLRGEVPAPMDRVTYHQAHRGAVQGGGDSKNARRRGLLRVASVDARGRKEIVEDDGRNFRFFNLRSDPGEQKGSTPKGRRTAAEGQERAPSSGLLEWLESVQRGLAASDDLPPPSLGSEDLEQLRALGYID